MSIPRCKKCDRELVEWGPGWFCENCDGPDDPFKEEREKMTERIIPIQEIMSMLYQQAQMRSLDNDEAGELMKTADHLKKMIAEDERNEVLSGLPKHPLDFHPNYEEDQPNAWVYIDQLGTLAILPKSGGWIGLEAKHHERLKVDVAPFCD